VEASGRLCGIPEGCGGIRKTVEDSGRPWMRSGMLWRIPEGWNRLRESEIGTPESNFSLRESKFALRESWGGFRKAEIAFANPKSGFRKANSPFPKADSGFASRVATFERLRAYWSRNAGNQVIGAVSPGTRTRTREESLRSTNRDHKTGISVDLVAVKTGVRVDLLRPANENAFRGRPTWLSGRRSGPAPLHVRSPPR
jgi:hypothetical protein